MNVRFGSKADILGSVLDVLLVLKRHWPVYEGRSLFILTDCTGSAFGSAAAGSVSAHVGCPFLLLKIIGALRLGRQLKHRRLLSLS